MGLQRVSDDVVGLRPDGVRLWRDEAASSSALVLDLGSPEAAAEALAQLREDGLETPVVLIGGPQDGWQEVAYSGGSLVALVPLPLSLTLLHDELERLTKLAEAPDPVWNSFTEPVADPAPEPQPVADAFESPVDFLSADSPVYGTEFTEAPSASPPPAEHTPAAPSFYPPESPTSVSAAYNDPWPSEAIQTPPPLESYPVVLGRTAALVSQLLPFASDLTRLADAAEAVTEEAVERTHAVAGALLIPDGPEWVVEGKHGLRPLEERLRLSDDHWLVETVIDERKGILVEDTDITRERMRNAPLASRRHLLALPFPSIAALLLLAREDSPFVEGDLTMLLALAAEAEPLLVEGLQVRALARALAPLTEFVR